MPRYIDADVLIKKIFPYDVVDKKCYAINAKTIYEEIKKAPTADVVPRSEVDGIVSQTLMETRALLYSAYDEIAELKKAKQEVARLKAEKDNLIATYEVCMKTYAEQLFEEIANILKRYETYTRNFGSKIGELAVKDIGCEIAELKKKYIGEKK